MNENPFFFTQHFLISVVVVGKNSLFKECVRLKMKNILENFIFGNKKKIDVFFCWFDPENKKKSKREGKNQ